MAYASVQDWLDRNSHRGFVADFDNDGEADELLLHVRLMMPLQKSTAGSLAATQRQ